MPGQDTKDGDMDQTYFAVKPQDELAPDLVSRVKDFFQFMQSSGIFQRIRKSYQAYYGMSDRGFFSSGLSATGEKQELTTIKVNQYRSLILGLLNLTTSQKASFEVRATNTDFKSQSQAILAQGILDYYLREKKLERKLRDAVELALVTGEGYIKATWEPTDGDQYGVNPETGAVIYEGDILYEMKNPLDIIKDVQVQTSEDPSWLIVRSWRNKFDLAAKNPEMADQILEISDNADIDFSRVSMTVSVAQHETEEIPVYEFFHKRSEALPNGRYVIFLDGETVLFDGPLPYREIPLYRVAAAELHGTPFGYSPTFDLLSIQEAYDAVHSTIISNQLTFGVQNIWTKPGAGIVLNQLRTGMNHIESEEEPKPLQLCASPPEMFNHEKRLEQLMEQLSGVNSTVRGTPPSGDLSGAAMALLASQAIQFNSGLQQAWASLLEDVGTATFQILQDFAKVPRIAVILGKHNRSYMKQFAADDVMQVSRVVVDLGNPVMRTTAGRVEIANQLLQAQKFDTPEQYLSVIKTGNLDTLTENEQSSLLNIKAENENLQDGKPARALVTDNHHLHILEHLSVLDDPDAREEPNISQGVLAHVQDHLAQWRSADPAILMLRGLQPLPPPPPPPGMAPPQGPPGPPPGPPQAGPQPPHPGAVGPGPMDATNPTLKEAHGVKGPRMPGLPKGAPPEAGQAYQQVKANVPA